MTRQLFLSIMFCGYSLVMHGTGTVLHLGEITELEGAAMHVHVVPFHSVAGGLALTCAGSSCWVIFVVVEMGVRNVLCDSENPIGPAKRLGELTYVA